jgi:hypothetical protein
MNQKKQILTIPTNYNEDLAEETGIHIGDGSMNFYKSVGKNYWGYVHSTHAIDDKQHSDYVKKIMKKLYGIYPYERFYNNCVMLIYTRKNLVLFKKEIGLPMGKKTNIRIPDWVLANKEFTKKCVRGITDSDGCFRFRKPFKGKLNSYPEIKISNRSQILIYQLGVIFTLFGLKPYVYEETKKYQNGFTKIYCLNLNGVKNMQKYIHLFGSSNDKHLRKYVFWKKYGYYTKEKYGGTEI